MPEPSFAEFLRRSFEALERELPAVYARLCRTLAPRQLSIQVGGEQSTVHFSADGLRLTGRSDRPPLIEVVTTRGAILDLVDARRTLVDVVFSDALLLRGDANDLLSFHDGLMVYLHGAIRAPSFPHLLRGYRGESATAHMSIEERGR